jgi:hypothetical protein
MVASQRLDRYLLGDNPFIGVDHLSHERARQNQNRLNTAKIIKVIDTAMASGAEGLLITTHPVMYDVLDEMKARSNNPAFGLYALLPYAYEYARMATEKGIVGLASEVLSELSLKSKMKALAAGFSLFSMDPDHLLRSYVDVELERLSKKTPSEASLRSILLHEVITDLAVSFEADQLLKAYASHILNEYHVRPGFATRNFARFVAFAEKIGLGLDQIVILTPFNKVGFQMNPSKETCEETLNRLGDVNIIAMSVLASGFLNLSDALQYLKEQGSIKSFVVGVSTETHARETFSQMRKILGD